MDILKRNIIKPVVHRFSTRLFVVPRKGEHIRLILYVKRLKWGFGMPKIQNAVRQKIAEQNFRPIWAVSIISGIHIFIRLNGKIFVYLLMPFSLFPVLSAFTRVKENFFSIYLSFFFIGH